MNPVSVITVTSEVRYEPRDRRFRNLPGEPSIRGLAERRDRGEPTAARDSVSSVAAEASPPLVGREDDLNELGARILAHRIVTVVGGQGLREVRQRPRAALGDARFEQLLATGRELALDEALAQMQQYLKEEP